MDAVMRQRLLAKPLAGEAAAAFAGAGAGGAVELDRQSESSTVAGSHTLGSHSGHSGVNYWDDGGEPELVRLFGPNWMQDHGVVVSSEGVYAGLEAGWMVCTLCGKQLAGFWTVISHFQGKVHQKKLYWLDDERRRAEEFARHAAAGTLPLWHQQQPRALTDIGCSPQSPLLPPQSLFGHQACSSPPSCYESLWDLPTHKLPPPPPPRPPAHRPAPGWGQPQVAMAGGHCLTAVASFADGLPPPLPQELLEQPCTPEQRAVGTATPVGLPPRLDECCAAATAAEPLPQVEAVAASPAALAAPYAHPAVAQQGDSARLWLGGSDSQSTAASSGSSDKAESSTTSAAATAESQSRAAAACSQSAPAQQSNESERAESLAAVVSLSYDAWEMAADGRPEIGYLAVNLGDSVRILSDPSDGETTNRFPRYVFAQGPSGDRGWLPTDCFTIIGAASR
eukprot:TRINITY_DN69678_c0_g1_i1.p1 TRINITY_DN69678_c0_g1~~TRINITY_DN69678_c0_g1_i1.p1  ORF type:complete len:452 (-),score=91.70 TRINITY_DN69678_c0_g1_i1:98-1453(-)